MGFRTEPANPPADTCFYSTVFIFIQGVESVGNPASGVSEEEQRRAAPTTTTSTTTTTMPSFSETSGKRGHPACVCVCVLECHRRNGNLMLNNKG